jgi:hypothetical protein
MKTKDITLYQREDGIVVYQLHNLSRTTIDLWVDIALEISYYHLNNNYHMRIINILDSVYPTIYTMKKVANFVQESPKDVFSSVALVSNNSIIEVALKPIYQHIKTIRNSTIKGHYTEERTLHWLEQRNEIVLRDHNIQSLTSRIYDDDMKLIESQQ